MKGNLKKRIATCLVAVTMILGLFTGCGDSGEPVSSGSAASSGATASAEITPAVDKDTVKIACIALRKIPGMLIGHQGIGNAHSFYITAKDLCPFGIDLITQKKSLPLHSSGDLRCFTARGGTQITDPLAGARIQQCYRCHGAGLL